MGLSLIAVDPLLIEQKSVQAVERTRVIAETLGMCIESLSSLTEWQLTVSGGKSPKKCFQIPTLFKGDLICF